MLYGTLNTDPGLRPPARQYPVHFPRDVPGDGTSSHAGHFLRQPGTDWYRRTREQGIKGQQLRMDLSRRNDSDLRKLELRHEFLSKTEPKVIRAQIQLLARAGVTAVNRELKKRQEALKKLLIEDELRWKCLEEELNEQQKADRLEEAKKYTEKVRAEQEAQRLEVARQKRELQDRLRVEELRTLESASMLIDCKQVNLGQIRDKRERLEADREENRMFADLNRKLLQSQWQREEDDARKQLARAVQQQDALRAQIAYQNQKSERHRNDELCLEADRIKLLQEDWCKEKKKELEERFKGQDKVRADFEGQISLRRRCVAEAADREAAEEERIIRENKEKLAQEKSDLEKNKASARLEMSMYLNHVAAVKEEQEEQLRKEEKLYDEHRVKMEKLTDKRRCKEYEAQRKLVAKTLSERARQIQEKEETRRWEEEIDKEEKKEMERLRKCQQELRAQYEQRKLEEKRRYADDLNKQMAYQSLLKKREKEENERFLKRCEEEEEKFAERVQELLHKPQKYGTHPFRLKIEGRALSWPQ